MVSRCDLDCPSIGDGGLCPLRTAPSRTIRLILETIECMERDATREVRKILTQARDTKVAEDEAKATATENTCKLLLARENAVAAGHRADALLSERSTKLQVIRLVVSMVCAPISLLCCRLRPLWLIASGSCPIVWSAPSPRAFVEGWNRPCWPDGLSF